MTKGRTREDSRRGSIRAFEESQQEPCLKRRGFPSHHASPITAEQALAFPTLGRSRPSTVDGRKIRAAEREGYQRSPRREGTGIGRYGGNALMSATLSSRPDTFWCFQTDPVSVSVTVRSYSTSVSAATKTQNLWFTARPSTTFMASSMLFGVKNQKTPASSVRGSG